MLRNKYKIFLLPIFLFAFTNAFSQQHLLTVEEAVAAALERNYEIQLVRNDSAVFALNDFYSDAVFWPRINASGAYTQNRNNQKQTLADGSERKQTGLKSNNIQGSINLNWTIFDGFKMFATRNKSLELAKLGELNMKQQIVNTTAEVISNYYGIVRQKQQLKAVLEQMDLNIERASIAEKKLQVGLGAKPELLQARLDLNAQKAARLNQLSLIDQLKTSLNLLIGFKEDAQYDVSDSIPVDHKLSLGETMTNFEQTNPQLMLTNQNLKIAEYTLKERKAERYPTLSFNSAYNYSRTQNHLVINQFTPLLNRNNGMNYGFGISIPILNGGNVRRGISEAKLDIQYQNLLLDFQKAQIRRDILNAYKNYDLQLNQLALEEENILAAKENVYISSERLRLGITTSLELREAQKSLQDAYNRLIAARYNAKLAETELKRLQGKILN